MRAWSRRADTPLDFVAVLRLWNLQWKLIANRTSSYPHLTALQARSGSRTGIAPPSSSAGHP